MIRYMYYILPPLFYLAVALTGSAFTASGMDGWYQSLLKPAFTPPGGIIGAAWTLIYILSAISFMLFLNSGAPGRTLSVVAGLFVLNGVINAGWCWVFFTVHMLRAAVVVAALIGISVAALIAVVWPYSRLAGVLLVPYLSWVSFATYLSYEIYRLNSRG